MHILAYVLPPMTRQHGIPKFIQLHQPPNNATFEAQNLNI